ncbi:MAG: NAD(P)-binding protein [Proteobacteria bacterium]|nr:NAD(P)-binding protein [Pseudomonadota bacterium]
MSRRSSRPPSDRALGLDRAITRRDFVHGVAAGGAALLGGAWPWSGARAEALPPGAQDLPGYYPPRLTGLRGSHAGAFEAAHALRDGTQMPPARDSAEDYDLVVVGGGISGLAAAHFYRERRPAARVLVLDNHDDFGGHAKRNEFELDGRLHLMNGGTLLIDSPRPYSAVPAGLLRALGIDADALAKSIQHPEFYQQAGLEAGVFFDREHFGADHLAVGYRSRPWKAFLAHAPLSAAAKRDLVRIEEGGVDPLPGLSSDDKKRRLMKISYRAYLAEVMRAHPAVVELYSGRTRGEWGVGGDAVSALDAWGIGLPGFEGLGLAPGSIDGMGFTPAGYADTGGSVRLHFPDGNATIARALVRRLVPAAVPGTTIEDLVTARVDYARLDRPGEPVRLRLSSTAIAVRHEGPADGAERAVVTYVRDGAAYTVRARDCVLACYNCIIPYLVPELPAPQKAALHELVKTPLVYTTVALRHWRAWQKLGVHQIYAPGGYHSFVGLNPTVDIGGYRSTRSPDEPILVRMMRTPCRPGLPEHEQNKAGRAELLATPFEVFEREIRAQLARLLGPGGFDPATDITAITVNRWPHGYAPENNSLFDPDVPEGERAHVRGRARFGRIAIANSDSGGGAYTDVAIEQAHRAVSELLGA